MCYADINAVKANLDGPDVPQGIKYIYHYIQNSYFMYKIIFVYRIIKVTFDLSLPYRGTFKKYVLLWL